jgi:hypothetical protein
MDPISNADRLVRLLRQQLEQKAKAKKEKKSTVQQPVRQSDLDYVRGITGAAAKSGLDDRQMHRMVVEHLLGEQFGADMVNEPRFQNIVDKVVDIMVEDPTISNLLLRVSAKSD